MKKASASNCLNETDEYDHIFHQSSSKVERMGMPCSCLYASSIYVIQGWLELHHTWPAGFSSIYVIGQLKLSRTVHTTKN